MTKKSCELEKIFFRKQQQKLRKKIPQSPKSECQVSELSLFSASLKQLDTSLKSKLNPGIKTPETLHFSWTKPEQPFQKKKLETIFFTLDTEKLNSTKIP